VSRAGAEGRWSGNGAVSGTPVNVAGDKREILPLRSAQAAMGIFAIVVRFSLIGL